MATSSNVFKNLGKSVAYSSLDVLTTLAPNTMEIARGARSGLDATRDFIRTNTTKLRTTTTQYDRSASSKRARAFLEDAWKDIRSGNLALGDLSDQSFDDWDSYMNHQSGSSTISYSDQNVDADDAAQSNQSFGAARAPMSTDYRTIAGMRQLTTVIGKTQIKTAEYQTTQITNAIFMQMANQNDHFITMERQLDSINKNLVQLVKFQSESQSVTNRAQMSFFDSMTQYLKKQEKRQIERARRTNQSSRNKTSQFLSEDWFDMSSYKDMVKSNIQSSELGGILSSLGMIDPTMIGMMLGGPGGKIQPQRFALNALLKALVPKQARRSLGRGDSQINTMTKTMLTRLGGYRYTMDRGGKDTILGLLGTIFGIDPTMKRTLRMGDFKRGEMSWNGEAQKALVTVIPKELAEIKAAITKANAKYFDSTTGRFLSEDQVRKRASEQFRDVVERPFANIFNRDSMNPEEMANKKFWQGMRDEVQDRIGDIVDTAVRNTEGMTEDLSNQLHRAMEESIKTMGGTQTDIQRMALTLTEAVNKARAETASYIERLQQTDSAFTQIAMDHTNEYGNMGLDDFLKFINADAVNLRSANSGEYTLSGKRRSAMSREERERYEASERAVKGGLDWMKNLKNHRNPIMRSIGKIYSAGMDRYTGTTQSPYSRAMSGAVDSIFGRLYDVTMLGGSGANIDRGRHEATTSMSADQEADGRTAYTGDGRRGGAHLARRRSGGIVNQAVTDAEHRDDPEYRNVHANEQTAQNIEETYGKNGFMRRFFDSPAMKKLMEWFNKSEFGKKVKDKASKAKNWVKDLFTQDYTDEDGNVTPSVRSNLADLVTKAKDGLARSIGIDPKTGQVESDSHDTIIGAAASAAERIDASTSAMTGEESAEDTRKNAKKRNSEILKALNQTVRKKAPKVLTGGVLGALAGVSMGGSTGLLGSLFLPGGPIGGAIAGMGLSILADTEAFKSVMFGKKNEAGEREGGLISQKMVDGFKKALPTLGIGATAGVILKMLGSAAGVSSSVAGIIPKMMLPGGIMGAAIMGAAGAFALRNENVQNILFGEKQDDGSRQGAFLSNMYNRLTGKIKGATAAKGPKKSLVGKVTSAIKGAGLGAVAGATLSKLGLLGSTMSLGGPIGAAIAGAALGIVGSSDKFNDYLYGTKGDDGKRKKDGLLSRVSTMLKLNFIEPAGIWFKSTMEEFAWWAKEKIEVPFRLAFGPIMDAFQNLGTSMKEGAHSMFDKIHNTVKEKLIDPIGNVLMKYVLKPIGKVAGGLLKGGLFGAASLIGAPFQALSMLVSPERRKGQKLFGNFLKDNRKDNLNRLWADREAAGERVSGFDKFMDKASYSMATMPLIGNFFRNSDTIADISEYYGESEEGKRNNLGWLSAGRDRKKYRENRKAIAKQAKNERALSKLRQQWGAKDHNISDRVDLSDTEFAQRTKLLKKYGIDIKDQDELRQFQFHYDEWKNPKPAADAAGTPEAETASNVSRIRELMEKAAVKLGIIADATKASVDLETGAITDTEDIPTGEIADTIDSDMAGDIQNAKSSKTFGLFRGYFDKIFKRKKRDADHEAVTGNTSGNATDGKIGGDSPDGGYSEQELPSDREEQEDDTGILSTFSKGAGSFIKGLIGGKGLLITAGVGLLTAILSNPELRTMIGNLLGDAFAKIPDLIKNGLSNAGHVIKESLGITDEDGNRTAVDPESGEKEIVKNNNLGQAFTTAALNPKGALGAVKGIVNMVPGGKLVTGAIGKIGKGLSTLGGKLADTKLGKAVTEGAGKLANFFTNVGKAAKDKVASVASGAAAKVAATAAEDTNFGKAIKLLKGLFEKACDSKLGKAAGKAFKKLTKLFDDILKAFANAGPKFATFLSTKTPKLAAALTKMGVLTATGVSPAALLNVGIAAYSAINGAANPEQLFKINEKYVDGKMRTIAAIFGAVTGYSGAGAVLEILSEIVDELCGFDLMQSIALVLYHAIADDDEDAKVEAAIKAFKQEVANYNAATGSNLSASAYSDLTNKSLLGDAWDWIRGKKKDYSSYDPGLDAYMNSTNNTSVTPSSPNSAGYGPGMQNDPRWSRMPLGRFPNGRTSTMGNAGCGPTALSNAANMLGLGTNPANVGQFAISNGYIAQGGASDALFDQGANQMGLSSKRVNTTDDIISSLRAGKPVIMAGKSSGMGKGDPYTGAGHIVTATGIDARGNVTVQDPMRGTGKYKLSSLHNKMTGGWSVGRGATGYGLFDSIFGGAFSTLASGATNALLNAFGIDPNSTDMSGEDGSGSGGSGYNTNYTYSNASLSGSTQAEQIWNFLIRQGYTPYAAAGIMGCWEAESGNKSARIEGDYLGSFPGFNVVTASSQALDNYTTNKLFPAYARSNISINKSAYKGADGHYYPGFGLAQWTGPRGYNLFQFAKDNGTDWTELNAQLQFFNSEIAARGSFNKFNSATSPENGAHIVLDNYEMYPGFGAKRADWLTKRQSYARQYFEKFKLKSGGSSGLQTTSGPGSSRASQTALGYGVFDHLGSLFSGAIDTLYASLGLSQSPNIEDPSGTTYSAGAYDAGGTAYTGSGATYKSNGVVSEDQRALVDKMRSISGSLSYSLDWDKQNPDKGVASCASTVGWAYRKILGLDGMSASSTEQCKDSRFTTIYTNNGSQYVDLNQLQPGDIVYQNWDRTSNNGKMKHTEMYAGNGQNWSHGGNPAMGPALKDMNDYRLKHTMMVRRYNGFMNQGASSGGGRSGPATQVALGYGSGCTLNAAQAGQYVHDPNIKSSGYGTGISATVNNRGVETRLDTIIGLMRTLANSANINRTPAQTSLNVNYGAGDTHNTTVRPTVVVNQVPDRHLGERDASNEYLRTQHRRLAQAQHA